MVAPQFSIPSVQRDKTSAWGVLDRICLQSCGANLLMVAPIPVALILTAAGGSVLATHYNLAGNVDFAAAFMYCSAYIMTRASCAELAL